MCKYVKDAKGTHANTKGGRRAAGVNVGNREGHEGKKHRGGDETGDMNGIQEET